MIAQWVSPVTPRVVLDTQNLIIDRSLSTAWRRFTSGRIGALSGRFGDVITSRQRTVTQGEGLFPLAVPDGPLVAYWDGARGVTTRRRLSYTRVS